MMLIGLICVLFAIGCFFYVGTWRAILAMVHACRADDPSQRFSRMWWIPAWRYHKRRFPESYVRKRIVVNYALTWVWMGSAFALMVVAALRGRWPG
jgi:hypothetical protein